jgi:hypothetical protein
MRAEITKAYNGLQMEFALEHQSGDRENEGLRAFIQEHQDSLLVLVPEAHDQVKTYWVIRKKFERPTLIQRLKSRGATLYRNLAALLPPHAIG